MKKHLRLIGILLFVIILLNINLSEVWNCLLQANWLILLLVIFINLIVIFIRSLRWVKLVEIQQFSLGIFEAFWTYLISLYFGNITPARVGELSRAYYLMKYVKTNSAMAVSSIVFDRVLDMYFMLILGVVGLVFSDVLKDQYWIKIVFLFLMVLLAAFIFYPRLTIAMARILPNYYDLKKKSVNWLEKFFTGIKAFLSIKLIFPIFLTFFIYVLFFIQCLLLAYSMNLNINFFYLAFCVVVFSTVSILPVSISNMGTREFVLILMFSDIGISTETAVTYSLLFFITINLVLALLGWVTFVFYKGKNEAQSLSVKNLYNSQNVIK